jgi:hypothetical protein
MLLTSVLTRALTWPHLPGRLRPSSAAAVASLGAGRGLGPWLTAVEVRPRPRCARGFRSRTSSLHQVALGLCEGELGTWGDPRAKGGGTCASPHSKPLAGNPRARCGRSRCRHWALAVPAGALAVPALGVRSADGGRLRCWSWVFAPAPAESGVGGQEFPPDVAGTSSGGLTVPASPTGFGVGAGPEGRENPKKYRTALDRTDGVEEPTKHRTPIGADTVLAQVGRENRQKATK